MLLGRRRRRDEKQDRTGDCEVETVHAREISGKSRRGKRIRRGP